MGRIKKLFTKIQEKTEKNIDEINNNYFSGLDDLEEENKVVALSEHTYMYVCAQEVFLNGPNDSDNLEELKKYLPKLKTKNGQKSGEIFIDNSGTCYLLV